MTVQRVKLNFALLLLFVSFSLFSFGQTTQITKGSYIIDMGRTPQTVNNALRPYGLVYKLVKDYQVPVLWAVNQTKTNRSDVDFTHNGKSYRYGPFIILKGYRSAAVDALINQWKASYSGLTVDTTVGDFSVNYYKIIEWVPVWTLDAQNGSIAQGYLNNAGIPATGYNWLSPQQLTCCNDLFAMPHADPRWSTHSNLYTWNKDTANGGCRGWIWAACHAVSALENMTDANNAAGSGPFGTTMTNFLTERRTTSPTQSMVYWGAHSAGTVPYSNTPSLGGQAFLQYVDNLAPATENGSEQIYIPTVRWRRTTVVDYSDPDHPQGTPKTTNGLAAKLAYGPAYGDPKNGWIMYEAGHSHNKGTDVASIAAQRVFFNFSLASGEEKISDISTNTPATMYGGRTYQLNATVVGKTGPYSYVWTSACGGSFDNPYIKNPKFTPPTVSGVVNCGVAVQVIDACNRIAFESNVVVVFPEPQPPVAANDSAYCYPWLTVTVDPLANDVDPEGSPLTFTALSSTTTSNGVFTVNPDKTVTYDPNPSFTNGWDSLQYQTCDTGGLCDTAWIFIRVSFPDSDDDGIADDVDIDDDNDGIPDLVETGISGKDPSADQDGDGIPNYADPTPGTGITWADANNDGINDNFDFDGDGVPDHLDVDSDNDGIPDAIEANRGATPSNFDSNTGMITGAVGANGMPNIVETGSETGVSVYPGAGTLDSDGDGHKDYKDIDSDNDGITDAIEGNGGTPPANYSSSTGTIVTTVGTNGWPDSADPGAGGSALSLPNSDGDIYKDYIDIDADNDGIVDNIEGQSTAGYVGPTGNDTDGDGWDDAYDPDNGGTPFTPYNHDGTDNPDYRDLDSDNDSVPDIREGHDANSNGTADWDGNGNDVVNDSENGGTALNDSDGDGLLNLWDPDIISCSYDTIQSQGTAANDNGGCARIQNTDMQGDRDWRDIDDDNDGILTINEPNDVIGTSGSNPNGIKDYLERPCPIGYLANSVVDTLYVASVVSSRINGVNNPGSAANIIGIPNQTHIGNFEDVGTDNIIVDFGVLSNSADLRVFVEDWEASGDLRIEYSTNASSWTVDTVITTPPANNNITWNSVTFDSRSFTTSISSSFRYLRFTTLVNNQRVELDAVAAIREYISCTKAVTAVTDSDSTYRYVPVIIDIQANDINNTNDDTLDVTILEIRQNKGTVTVNADGTVTYSPIGSNIGLDSFYYSICSDDGFCDTALVIVKILAGPCGLDKIVQYTYEESGQKAYAVAVPGLIGDVALDGENDGEDCIGPPPGSYPGNHSGTQFEKVAGEDDTLIVQFGMVLPGETEVMQYFNGHNGNRQNIWSVAASANLNGPYTGLDTFFCNTNHASDSQVYIMPASGGQYLQIVLLRDYGASIISGYTLDFLAFNGFSYDSITISLSCVSRINAIDDAASTLQNVPINIDVQANDTNNTGDPTLTTSILSGPVSGGIVTVLPNGTVNYTPGANFTGLDSFYYYICSDSGLCDTALVEVTVEAGPCGAGKTVEFGTPGSVIKRIAASTDDAEEALTNSTGEVGETYTTSSDLELCDEDDYWGLQLVGLRFTGITVPQGAIIDSAFIQFTVDDNLTGGSTGTKTIRAHDVDNSGTFVAYVSGPANYNIANRVTTSASATWNPVPSTWNVSAEETADQKTSNLAAVVQEVVNRSGWNSGNSLTFIISGNGKVSAESYDEFPARAPQVRIYYKTLSCLNLPPVAVNDSVTTYFETPISIDLASNDYDPLEDTLIYNTSALIAPLHGAITIATNGTVLYTPDAGFTGQDSFKYVVCDSVIPANRECDTAWAFVTVTHNPPVAVNDADTTESGVPTTVNLFTNDSEPEAQPLNLYIGNTTNQGGSIVVGGDGNITYTSPIGFTGLDTIEYVICDGQVPDKCDTAIVVFLVNPYVNDPPIAVVDSSVTELNEAIDIEPLANDSDPDNDPISTVSAGTDGVNGQTGGGGTVTLYADGAVRYTPANNFTGLDSFLYIITDTAGNLDTAWNFIQVYPALNDPPIANNDFMNAYWNPSGSGSGVSTTVRPFINDYDLDYILDSTTFSGGNPTGVEVIVQPTQTSINVTWNPTTGEFTYTTDQAITDGTLDSFQYKVCDQGIPLPALCDTAWVYVTMYNDNDAPIANRDWDTTYVNQPVYVVVKPNDSDPEFSPNLVYTLPVAGEPKNGTASFTDVGKLEYIPDPGFVGNDTMYYQLCDDAGAILKCDTALVVVTVLNNAVIATPDESSTTINTSITVDVRVNDLDPDGHEFWITDLAPNYTFSSGTTASAATFLGGTVSVNNNGTPSDPTDDFVNYTPPTNNSGSDTFWYQVCDTVSAPNQGCAITYAVITIAPNQAPVALDDIDSTPINTPKDIDVLANDYDLTGELLPSSVDTISGLGPKHGNITFNATTGVITYTPDTDFLGLDTFTYYVCDDQGAEQKCDTAVVYIKVFDQFTIAVDDDNSTFVNVPVSGNVSTNDYDPEGDIQTFGSFLNQDGSGNHITSGATLSGINSSGTPVANAGTLTFSNGNYTFTPTTDFTGSVHVPYYLCDNGYPQACDTAALMILVTPGSDPTVSGGFNDVYANDDDAVSYGEPVSSSVIPNDGDPQNDPLTINAFTYDADGDGIPETAGGAGPTTLGGKDFYGNPSTNAGTITLNSDGTYTFTPSSGFTGHVVLIYEVCDTVTPTPNCATATLHITVYGDNGSANDPPFAGDDFAYTTKNTSVTGSWAGNDYDPNSDSITTGTTGLYLTTDDAASYAQTPMDTLTTAQGGTLYMYRNGTYTYTPPTNFYGPDHVDYTICDKASFSPQPLCAIGTIYLLVDAIVKDYGDLPSATYADAWNIYVDKNNDNIPEGALPIWLGEFVTNENETRSGNLADGDADDGLILPANLDSVSLNIFKVIVNSTVSSTTVYYRMWIDWDKDGTFDSTYAGHGVTGSPDTVDVAVDLPAGEDGSFFVRLRVSLDSLTLTPNGVMNNGETEDYFLNTTPLPVEFISFEAYRQGNVAILEWATATEMNNSHFEIERRNDDMNWVQIGTKAGSGNSVSIKRYTWTDEAPLRGVNYYRIKQVDFNGDYEYTGVRAVLFGEPDELVLYPNPTRDVVNVYLGKDFKGKARLVLTDMSGRTLIDRDLTVKRGDSPLTSVDLGHLSNGYYMIQIHTDQFNKVLKLLKD